MSIITGVILGSLAGWAFAEASMKRREAVKLRSEATKAREKEVRLKDQARDSKERSFSDLLQGVLFYALGISVVGIIGVIVVTSIG